MIPEALIQALQEVENLAVLPREPLARHNLLRVGGTVDLWLVAETETAAAAALKGCREAGVKLRTLSGEHWLARDEGLEGACLVMGAMARRIRPIAGGLEVGARFPLAALALFAGRAGLTGLEGLAGRPGTVADGLRRGLLGDRVSQLRVLRGSRPTTIKPEQWKETQAVVWVRLALSLELPATVLARTRLAASSVLDRPGRLMVDPDMVRAAELIREAGLPGVRLRAVRVGSREPNSLVNLGGATARDVALVLAMVRDRVKQQSGVELRVHPPHLGRAQAAGGTSARRSR